MIRAVPLRAEPTVRQTQTILEQVNRALTARGAHVRLDGPARVRFRMPLPWQRPAAGPGGARRSPGILGAITAGWVGVSAGAGERRRVRYDLDFLILRILVIVAMLVLIAAGLGWPRLHLINAAVLLWLVVYVIPNHIAARQFRRIVEASARPVVERRRNRRPAPANAGAVIGEPVDSAVDSSTQADSPPGDSVPVDTTPVDTLPADASPPDDSSTGESPPDDSQPADALPDSPTPRA